MTAPSMRDMERHPDIVEMRARYDLAAERPSAQMFGGLTFLTGLYLAISPWVVGFSGRTPLAINDLITGIALGLLAVGFASAYGRTHGVAWVAPVIGVWTIIAPWVISGDMATTSTVVNNVVTGAVAVVCGLGSAGAGAMSSRRR